MSIYHQIFYPMTKWQSPNDIQLLESFMYLKKSVEEKMYIREIQPNVDDVISLPNSSGDLRSPTELSLCNVGCVNAPRPEKPILLMDVPVSVSVSVPMKKQYYPKKPDTLFWCIYIALNGMKEYDQIGLHYGNIEMEEKQKIMELMKKTPNLIKNANKKITKVLSQEIMSDLMTNKRTTIDMLMIFAVYNNMRIILVNVDEKNQPYKSYIILGSQIYSKSIVIYKRKNNYGLEMDYQEHLVDAILEKLLCMEQIDKPLKAISNYKTDELEAIAYKLNVDYTTNKLKKQELYNGILMTLTSILG
jgi:hypothetical protein